jgi:hypothetical protein
VREEKEEGERERGGNEKEREKFEYFFYSVILTKNGENLK